jgi:hypothetical protein
MKLTSLLTTFAGRTSLHALLVLGLAIGIHAAPAHAQPTPAATAQVVLEQADAVTVAASDCDCPPKGCVRTQGYWGNKPNVVWPKGYSRTAQFFKSKMTWQEVLDAPVRGSAYLILAKQYIAAVLNIAAGASAPAAVRQVINYAAAFFANSTPATCPPGACATQKSWAATLDTYNNGRYPGAPKPCPE